MENLPVNLRPATMDDNAFIAWGVLTAVGIETPSEKQLRDTAALCRMDDVLYSYRNTFIAVCNEKASGMLCCYRGDDYLQLRRCTFPIIARNCGMDFSGMEMETLPGEFYIDSLAVLPEFRHHGLGTALLKRGIQQAAALNIARCTLIVSPENSMAQKLYEDLGFRYEKDLFVFNETYRKMYCPIISSR